MMELITADRRALADALDDLTTSSGAGRPCAQAGRLRTC